MLQLQSEPCLESMHLGKILYCLEPHKDKFWAWDVHENGTVEERMNMQLSEPVHGLLLADCCSGGSNDLWVIEGDHLTDIHG